LEKIFISMSIISSPKQGLGWFLNLSKTLPLKFERNRVWTPRSVMLWLMIMTFPDRKTSYRGALKSLEQFGLKVLGWSKLPSAASISMARRKMPVMLCRELLHNVVGQCQEVMGRMPHKYGTRRFIAFDGTRLVTRHSGDTIRKLHRYKRPNGDRVHNPQGLMVAAVDVFRRLPLDWVMVGKKVGERPAMMQILETLKIEPGDVAIMDRGLPSHELFASLLELGVDIVARMSTSDVISWNEIRPFLDSGKKSANIEIHVNKRLHPVVIQARLVERDAQPGRPRKGTKKERMVILTTLKAEDGFPREEIVKIYGARWGIETLFRELKSFMGVEPFHSHLVDGCEQEVAAALIWMALGSTIQAEAESTIGEKRVYRTDCLRAASDMLSDLLKGRDIKEDYARTLNALRQFSYNPRPGRHAPRECKMPFGRSVRRGPR